MATKKDEKRYASDEWREDDLETIPKDEEGFPDSPHYTDEQNETFRRIVLELQPRIVALMHKVRGMLTEAGLECSGISEATDEEFCWNFFAEVPDGRRKDGMGVRFTVCESVVHEGTEAAHVEPGLNFTLAAVAYYARPIGRIAPENHGPLCWVPFDDHDAVMHRFRRVEDGELGLLVETWMRYLPKSNGQSTEQEKRT